MSMSESQQRQQQAALSNRIEKNEVPARPAAAAAAAAAQPTTTRPAPSKRVCLLDTAMLLRVIFFLLGVGILIPWNAFISAKAYFESRLCSSSTTTTSGSSSKNLESTFAIVYNCSSVVSLGLLLLAQWLADQRLAAALQEATLDDAQQEIAPSWSSPPRGSSGAVVSTRPITGSGGGGGGERQSSNDSHSSNGSAAGAASSSSSSGHSFWLVMVPLSVYFVVFLGQAIAVLWIRIDPDVFYVLTITSLALCGICGALASSGIVATAGLFLPDIGIEPYIAGQPAGGIIVSTANLVAASYGDPMGFWNSQCSSSPNNNPSDGQDEEEQGTTSASLLSSGGMSSEQQCTPYTQVDNAVLMYFLLGSLVLAACIAGYAYIDHHQRSTHRDDYETIHDTDILLLSPTVQDSDGINDDVSDPLRIEPSAAQSPAGVEMNNALLLQRRSELLSQYSEEDETNPNSLSRPHTDHLLNIHATVHRYGVDTHMSFGHDHVLDAHHDSENETNEVWNIVRSPALSICLVFFVTLALFPGWVSQLRSVRQCSNSTHVQNNRWVNDLYTPLAFVVYNVGDFVGRIMAGYVPLSRIHHVSAKLITGSLLRFGLFPLLYLCVSSNHHHDDDHDSNKHWTIDSDTYSWLVQILFSVTNGFITTCAFVHAPSLLPNVTHVQERSAEILNFALYVGLLTGSLFSIPVSHIFAR